MVETALRIQDPCSHLEVIRSQREDRILELTSSDERPPLRTERNDVVIEASPLPTFATAAGHFPAGREIEIPADILSARTGDLYLRVVVRDTGVVLGTYKITP